MLDIWNKLFSMVLFASVPLILLATVGLWRVWNLKGHCQGWVSGLVFGSVATPRSLESVQRCFFYRRAQAVMLRYAFWTLKIKVVLGWSGTSYQHMRSQIGADLELLLTLTYRDLWSKDLVHIYLYFCTIVFINTCTEREHYW